MRVHHLSHQQQAGGQVALAKVRGGVHGGNEAEVGVAGDGRGVAALSDRAALQQPRQALQRLGTAQVDLVQQQPRAPVQRPMRMPSMKAKAGFPE